MTNENEDEDTATSPSETEPPPVSSKEETPLSATSELAQPTFRLRHKPVLFTFTLSMLVVASVILILGTISAGISWQLLGKDENQESIGYQSPPLWGGIVLVLAAALGVLAAKKGNQAVALAFFGLAAFSAVILCIIMITMAGLASKKERCPPHNRTEAYLDASNTTVIRWSTVQCFVVSSLQATIAMFTFVYMFLAIVAIGIVWVSVGYFVKDKLKSKK